MEIRRRLCWRYWILSRTGPFSDHYLEVEFDLSRVMFVTTANSLSVPPALLDRMEVIRLSGYTEDEKMEISRRHLLPRLSRDHGLRSGEWEVDDSALLSIIRRYTRESGVRDCERMLATSARKAVRRLESGESGVIRVGLSDLESSLGTSEVSFRRG